MFPLGPGPVPTTSTELADRLAAGLRTILHLGAMAPVQVQADVVSAAEITSLRVGASGVDVRLPGRRDLAFATTEGEVTVGRFEITAHPLRMHGVPVSVDAIANRLPATWRRTEGGDRWLVPHERAVDPAPDGTVELDVVVADVEAAVREIAARAAERQGLTLKSLEIDVRATSPRSVAVRIDARIGKSVLSGSLYLTGTISVDDAMRLTIDDLTLTSANRLVAALVSRAEPYLEPWNGRTEDLSLLAFAGASVRDVALTTENGHLHLHAVLG